VSSSIRRSLQLLLGAAALWCALLSASSAEAYPIHQVAAGETLSGIAAANGMPVAQLAAANGLAWNSFVTAGQVLQIPPQGVAVTQPAVQTTSAPVTATPAVQVTQTSSSAGGTQVQPGDTLSAIAARLGVSLEALAAANGISSPNFIVAGTTLHAPGAAGVSAPVMQTVSNTTSTSGPEGTAATTGAGSGTSDVRLDASQIASIAAQQGVPGDLADAVAWQESGFNNALVSPTGARGVMQVEPGTWDWVNNTLAKPPLLAGSATDNVRAGSLLLGQLLRDTGGDAATAIAGYYQGLDSVRSRGMYDDTKQYVNNVLALRQRFGG
jgi:LysM repeat protein